jgi:hypothetical protein
MLPVHVIETKGVMCDMITCTLAVVDMNMVMVMVKEARTTPGWAWVVTFTDIQFMFMTTEVASMDFLNQDFVENFTFRKKSAKILKQNRTNFILNSSVTTSTIRDFV